MRRSVVVTLLGTLACSKAVDPEVPLSRNPPAPFDGVVVPEPVPPPEPEPEPAPAGGDPEGRVLNGVHPEHGLIFRNPDGTCRVNLPFPEAEGPPISFRPPPTEVVPCPVHMKDPSWDACFGRVTTGPASGSCLCSVMGNPPPPPRIVSCPTEG